MSINLSNSMSLKELASLQNKSPGLLLREGCRVGGQVAVVDVTKIYQDRPTSEK